MLAVVLVLCAAFAALGRWQLDVARSKEAPKHPVVLATKPLDAVVTPQQTFRNDMVAQPVTVTGAYDASKQLLVSGRRQGGVDGFWVLTGLRVSSGALVPVVRGFVPARTVSQATLVPPPGPISLAGTLEPPDPAPADGDAPTVPVGQIPAADTADVVNLWGNPIYNVLLYAGSSGGTALQPVPAPPANQGGGLDLLNAAYAVQWWLFGVFALLLWWKMVRQDAEEAAADDSAQDQPQDNRPKELSSP
jgi:cytochrome oxidase assembly protein ShyY1